jgi:DNA polymerase-1
VAVAFDTEEPTARHLAFPAYKATRQVMPEELSQALPHIRRLLAAFRIPILTCPGFEADDVIGTLARRAEKEGFSSYMVTLDKDFAQLVDAHTFLYKPGRTGDADEILGVAEICQRWGVHRPEQVVDVLALSGDTSDNIPGVPGIGEKTAAKLVAQYGTVEELLAHAAELPGRLKENLQANRDQALLSKRLATIVCDAPCGVDPEALKAQPPDEEKLKGLLIEFEFNSIGRRLFGPDFKAGRGLQPGPTELTGEAPEPAKGGAPSGRGTTEPPVGGTPSGGETTAPQVVTWASCPSPTGQAPARTGETPVPRPAPREDLILVSDDTPLPPSPQGAKAPAGEPKPPTGANLKTIADVPHEYHLVATPTERAELIARLGQSDSFCLDTETTSLDPKAARLVGLSFSLAPHTGHYVPVPQEAVAAARLLEEFRPALESERIEKVGHNLKFDLSVLRWQGVTVRGKLFDTMVAHSLIEPELRHGLDYLAEAYLGYSPIPISRLLGEAPGDRTTMADVPVARVAEYSAEDADVTLQLRAVLEPLLGQKGQERVFYELEAPLIPVLVAMEHEGIKVDAAALAEFGGQLAKEIDQQERAICRLAGTTFNLNSPKQLGQVLFDVLKIGPPPKRTRTGQYATDERTLALLAPDHEIVQRLLEYRAAAKLKSTYADALPDAIWPPTGRVHTTFSQVLTATGRLSSQNPNLQNIPIRTERGQEIRKAFVPRNADYRLLSADYSQIELRILAALSREAGLLEAFRGGADIHTATAARIYNLPLDLVTPEMRRKAKMVNYGIAYGISAFGLAQRLGIPRAEAGAMITQYFKKFPGLRRYMDHTVAEARRRGYVETVTGRRRYIRDIQSLNNTLRSAAERNAINAPVQGTAADMIKLAMIAVHRELARRGLRTRLLLQVHDELLFDLYVPEEAEVRALVQDRMQNAISLHVPTVVEIGVGQNWLEAH